MKLTENMRAALLLASKQPVVGLRRKHEPGPGKPPWPAHPASLAALVRHGLLERSSVRSKEGWPVDVWTITEEGELALNPPVVAAKDTVRHLRRGGGYTSMLSQSIDIEAEGVDPREVAEGPTAVMARERWLLERAKQSRARARLSIGERVEQAIEEAKRSGVDAERYERQILGRVKALENRTKKAA